MTVGLSGMVSELALAVDRSVDVPLGHQVQEALRSAIRSGRLRSGERLPSTRQLASQLGVSRGLVVLVYEQLLAEGYVVSAVGSGTRVADGFNGSGDATPLASVGVDPARPGRCRRSTSATASPTFVRSRLVTGCGRWAMRSR